MKYLSLDIETTGLDTERDQIIEFGCIAVDTNQHPSTWKTLHTIIKHDRVEGSPYAIALNARIFEFLQQMETDPEDVENDWNVITPDQLFPLLLSFLQDAGFDFKNGHFTITVAGKNAMSFDVPFLKNHFNKFNNLKFVGINDPRHDTEQIRFAHRGIDPSILYADFTNDERLPSLSECKKRANLDINVSHHALEDAWDVVMLICKHSGYDFSKVITEDYLNKYYVKDSRLSRDWSPCWVIAPGLYIRKESFSDSPFRNFKIINMFGQLELYIWSTLELDSMIQNSGA